MTRQDGPHAPPIRGPGRSRMRRIAQHRPEVRERPLMRRWGIALLCTGVVTGLILAVARRSFATDGLIVPVYWMHDQVYLPLKGQFWTAMFPYALLWLVPTAVIAAVLLVEWLSRHGPVRAIHRAAILALIGRGYLTWVLIGWRPWRLRGDGGKWVRQTVSGTGPGGGYRGFMRRVIEEAFFAGWDRATRGSETEMKALPPGTCAGLEVLASARLRLEGPTPQGYLAALEVVVLAQVAGRSDWRSGPLKEDFARLDEIIWRDADAASARIAARDVAALGAVFREQTATATGMAREAGAELLQANATMQAAVLGKPLALAEATPVQLACTALRFASRAADGTAGAQGVIFLDLWATGRAAQAAGDLAARLHTAERLIDFETWAALIETAAMQTRPQAGHIDSVLSATAAGAGRAERFARTGAGQ